MVLFGLCCLFLLAMTFFSYDLQVEYGTDSGSLVEGGWEGMRAGTGLGVVAAALAIAAIPVSGGKRLAWVLSALVLVAVIGGPFAGGALAAKQKYASLPDAPQCYDPEFDPATGARLRQIDGAFRELDNPEKFSGGGGTGIDGCDAPLLNVDLATAATHYRQELPRHGWTVREDNTRRMTATRGNLTFRLFERDGMPTVHIGPLTPTLP